MTESNPPRPTNTLLAIVAAALPYPALYAIDRATRPCGDGLCSFFPGVIAIGTLVLATIIFLVRGGRRGEQPAWLRVVPPLLWLVVMGRVMV